MGWHLFNLRQRFHVALRNPGYALEAVLRDVIWADERFLARVTGSKPADIRRFLGEQRRPPSSGSTSLVPRRRFARPGSPAPRSMGRRCSSSMPLFAHYNRAWCSRPVWQAVFPRHISCWLFNGTAEGFFTPLIATTRLTFRRIKRWGGLYPRRYDLDGTCIWVTLLSSFPSC
jgi:hypothetical protein